MTTDPSGRRGRCAHCAAARRASRLRLGSRVAMSLVVAAAGMAWGVADLPAAAACGGGGVVSEAGAGWIATRPDFPVGPPAVTMIAAPAFAPDSLYASNGAAVAHSPDAGCSWRIVFNAVAPLVSDGPAVPDGYITALAAPSSATQSSTAYVAVATGVADARRPLVYRTVDSGATWEAASAGLPPVGVVTELAVSDQVPLVAYARVEVTPAPVQLQSVYRTQDAGETWERRGGFGPPAALQVHQRRDNVVFAVDDAGVVISEDAADSFRPALADVDVADVDSAVGNAAIRLVAGDSRGAAVHRSDDDGATWTRHPSPLIARHVSMAPLQDVVAVSDGRELALVGPAVGARVITPDLAPIADVHLSAPAAGRFAVAGLADGVILRLIVDDELRPVPSVRREGRLLPVRILPYIPLRQFPATLMPERPELTLPAGGSGAIPLDLVLPRTPMPLDVVFHVDTTGSMQGVINGLRQDLSAIVNALQQIGLDSWFGLVDFKDYPPPDGGGSPSDYPYRLSTPVGPPGDRLAAGLNSLSASGGGDSEESQLSALFQSTTGAGETTADGSQVIAPGHDAGYRPGSLRLTIVATDVGFHRGGGLPRSAETIGYPGPTFEQTSAAMRRRGVFQVGLAAAPGALDDLQLMARQTRTLAPAGGVDCDGDGESDLTGGEPLVCQLAGGFGISVGASGTGAGGLDDPASAELGPAVVAMAEALPNLAPVTVQAGGPAGIAAVAAVSRVGEVNLKADNELGFALQLRCPTIASRTSYQIPLTALAGGRRVADAAVTLTCEPPPETPAAAPEVPLPLPAVAVAVLLPPAAPQPIVQPNPNLNPNPNANVNSNPQANAAPNGAVAAQEEHQHQLAAAYAPPPASEGTTELAAVRHDRDDGPMVLFVAALALTAGAGALASRRAAQHAAAHCRVWH